MKTTIAVCGAAIMLLLASATARAGILAGPITNPSNGHDYYLLTPNTWSIAEAEAESLGGTLATIQDTNEQAWVFSSFSGKVNHNGLWIGLHRIQPGGPFVWVTSVKLDYADWNQGEPNNAGGTEDCVHMNNGDVAAGTWNDLADDNLLNGVVELPGKADEISLSKSERALIGAWYEGGKMERPCWIAGTDTALFVIPSNQFAARAGFCAGGSLFVAGVQGGWPMAGRGFGGNGFMPGASPQTGLRGEIIEGRILWNNGTWWSRKPVAYGQNREVSDKGAAGQSADAPK